MKDSQHSLIAKDIFAKKGENKLATLVNEEAQVSVYQRKRIGAVVTRLSEKREPAGKNDHPLMNLDP